MSHKHDGLRLDTFKDAIWFLQLWIVAVLSLAFPFATLWTVPGHMGRRSFGWPAFIGLAFLYPMFGQWPHDSLDNRIFIRSWEVFWILCVAQKTAAHLFNKRLGVHSREQGDKAWVGRQGGLLWPLLLVSLPAHVLVEPVCHGLGTYLTVAPLFYALSYLIVNAKLDREVEEVEDARIAARDFAHRMGRD